MADDDAEDCLLVRDALREAGCHCDLRFVRDGEELFDYLAARGRICRWAARAPARLDPAGPENAPQGRPRNAARIEGRSALAADSRSSP